MCVTLNVYIMFVYALHVVLVYAVGSTCAQHVLVHAAHVLNMYLCVYLSFTLLAVYVLIIKRSWHMILSSYWSASSWCTSCMVVPIRHHVEREDEKTKERTVRGLLVLLSTNKMILTYG